ncbi:addiction module protein [bacterium]|nr:addiction module protein [bacterium]
MQNVIDIKHLTRDEKLKTMEALWEALSTEEELLISPAWHKTVLRETEADFKAKKEEVLDWGQAKKALRKRFK